MTEKTYTEDEAMHLVAREVAKQRMGDLERTVRDGETKTAVGLAELKTQIGHVILMIDKKSLEEDGIRKEFKKDIDKEFATKIDLQRLENKLDQMWLKITVSVAAIVGAGVFVSWLLGAANVTKTLMGH